VPELHAHATGLPFLDYLLEDPQRSVLLSRGRVVPVAVPHPGRFALHKLAVHSLRSPADDAKRAKDLVQATALFEALAEDADVLLGSAAEAMTKQLRTKARSGARRVLKALQGNTAAARAQRNRGVTHERLARRRCHSARCSLAPRSRSS
jgi:hypothetical protein